MKVNPNEDNRLIESQEMLRSVMSEAVGIYMAKEPSEKDDWRDKSLWQVFQHLKHEIEEIDKSDSRDRFYHNCLDAIGLLAMMAIKVGRSGNSV